MRKTLLLYLMSIFVIYTFLVIDNISWSLYDGTFIEKISWIFTSEFSNWQGIFTILSMGLFLALVLRDRIIRDFIYPFGMVLVYLVLGIDKVLLNLDMEFYKIILSVFLFEQNWIAMFIGAFIFLFYYNRFKNLRRSRTRYTF